MMNQELKLLIQHNKPERFSKKISHMALASIVMLMATNSAFADLAGGLGKAESAMNTLKDWGIRLAGVAAVLYILWKALETWCGRGDWGEFAISAAYVAIAGASPAIANWAWTAFQ